MGSSPQRGSTWEYFGVRGCSRSSVWGWLHKCRHLSRFIGWYVAKDFTVYTFFSGIDSVKWVTVHVIASSFV